jgi:exodeoxyribonuclease VII large subunit
MNMKLNNYTVTEINKIIKSLLFENIGKVSVTGEASNVKYHTSGHIYFSLKDENNSVIRCVMFKYYTKMLNFKLSNGMKVIVSGNIDVYLGGGYYQIKVVKMEELGEGILLKKFEELKNKLSKEGLFDAEHKKILPKFPKSVGVITSETGAAIQDIIRVIKKRFPLIVLVLYPAAVQGDNAKYEVVQGLEYFNKHNNVDVIISGRGGGSIEDLWAFNEEIVARAIFKSKIPVISAVGHEIDYTISDFVADYRAATPSAAAEIVVPDKKELLESIIIKKSSLKNNLLKILKFKKNDFEHLKRNRFLINPYLILEEKMQRVDLQKDYIFKAIKRIITDKSNKFTKLKDAYVLKNINYQIDKRKEKLNILFEKLKSNVNFIITNKINRFQKSDKLITNINLILSNKKNKFQQNHAHLRILSPLNILDRGYSIVLKNDLIIKNSANIKIDDILKIKFAKGEAETIITGLPN